MFCILHRAISCTDFTERQKEQFRAARTEADVDSLLQNDFTINGLITIDGEAHSPLYCSCKYNTAISKILIEKGATLSEADWNSFLSLGISLRML